MRIDEEKKIPLTLSKGLVWVLLSTLTSLRVGDTAYTASVISGNTSFLKAP